MKESFDKRLRRKITYSKHNHIKRGIEVIGSVSEFVHTYTGECIFCGEEFDIFSDDRTKSGTLDRIDNNGPLTPDNVQWLCHRCNTAKGQLTTEEYFDKIIKTYEEELDKFKRIERIYQRIKE